MKKLNKMICASLTLGMAFTTCSSAFAATLDNSPTDEDNNLIASDNLIEYQEQRDDGLYWISEKIDGNKIESTIYKMNGTDKTFDSKIYSTIYDGKVECTQIDSENKLKQYTINSEVSEVSELSMGERSTTYLRTDKYGISLVGKKITVAIAAAAIVAATAYVSLPIATKIIITSIASGGGAGVASLPNYLYVTSKVYRAKTGGKIYNRYKNSYYLDKNRSQYVGNWTFSKRWGH